MLQLQALSIAYGIFIEELLVALADSWSLNLSNHVPWFYFYLKVPIILSHEKPTVGPAAWFASGVDIGSFTGVCLCPGTELVVVPLHREFGYPRC